MEIGGPEEEIGQRRGSIVMVRKRSHQKELVVRTQKETSEKGVQLGVDSCLMENKHFSGAWWNQNRFKK